MIVTVHVGVALTRPPTLDEYRRYKIEADTEHEASLIALQMAEASSVMPVWCAVVDINEI